MHKSFVVICTFLIATVLLVACGSPPAKETAAQEMLPELSGYDTIDGQSFTDALTTLGVMTTLIGQPELGAPIAAVSEVVDCYQAVGAISARVYSSQSDPIHSGVVAIGDRNALLDPVTFLQCVVSRRGPGAQAATIQPCTHSYTLPRDDNEFYILYAGLTPEICAAFCANLEGCTQ